MPAPAEAAPAASQVVVVQTVAVSDSRGDGRRTTGATATPQQPQQRGDRQSAADALEAANLAARQATRRWRRPGPAQQNKDDDPFATIDHGATPEVAHDDPGEPSTGHHFTLGDLEYVGSGTVSTADMAADLRQAARAIAAKHGLDPDVFERQAFLTGHMGRGGGPQALKYTIETSSSPAEQAPVAVDGPPRDLRAQFEDLAREMTRNLERYQGDYRRAVAAVVAGPEAVDHLPGVERLPNVQSYLHQVLGAAQAAVSWSVTPALSGVPGGPASVRQIRPIDQHLSYNCGPASVAEVLEALGKRPPGLSDDDWIAYIYPRVHEGQQFIRGTMGEYSSVQELMTAMGSFGVGTNHLRTIDDVRASAGRGHYVIGLFAMGDLVPGQNYYHFMVIERIEGNTAIVRDSFGNYSRTGGTLRVSLDQLGRSMNDGSQGGPMGLEVKASATGDGLDRVGRPAPTYRPLRLGSPRPAVTPLPADAPDPVASGRLIKNGPYYSDPHFEDSVQRYAERIRARLGSDTLADFAIAQARWETGHGKLFSTPYNFANWGNTDSNPKGGGGYRTPEEAADAYVRFLTENSRYARVLAAARAGADVPALAQLIAQAGWATDPHYAANIVSVWRPADRARRAARADGPMV